MQRGFYIQRDDTAALFSGWDDEGIDRWDAYADAFGYVHDLKVFNTLEEARETKKELQQLWSDDGFGEDVSFVVYEFEEIEKTFVVKSFNILRSCE